MVNSGSEITATTYHMQFIKCIGNEYRYRAWKSRVLAYSKSQEARNAESLWGV